MCNSCLDAQGVFFRVRFTSFRAGTARASFLRFTLPLQLLGGLVAGADVLLPKGIASSGHGGSERSVTYHGRLRADNAVVADLK